MKRNRNRVNIKARRACRRALVAGLVRAGVLS
jgi:hypothetical protein